MFKEFPGQYEISSTVKYSQLSSKKWDRKINDTDARIEPPINNLTYLTL